MRPLAEEKRLRLTALPDEPDGREITVKGDETQLRRVLANLVENAIRHTDADGEIEASACCEGAMAEWRVRDSGFGIPEEHLSHIFERFYRVDKARSRERGRSGLRLAICSQIGEAHGGDISVESVPGEGSTFIIRLPVA
ncbi:sensor histidine kinase [Candidatus Bipolaricaulota bacterium]